MLFGSFSEEQKPFIFSFKCVFDFMLILSGLSYVCVCMFTLQIQHPDDERQCKNCPKGTIPNRDKMVCLDIPEQYLRPESWWAIGAMAFSSSGMIITFLVAGVFLR